VGVDPHRRPLAARPERVALLHHQVRHRSRARRYPPPPLPAGPVGDRPPRPVPTGHPAPDQITTLQALPGWVWDVKTSRWNQGLRLLTAYAHRTGAPNPDSYYIEDLEDTEGNFTLGAWAMSRRKEYRRGVLSPTRIAALEAVIDRLAVDLRAAFPEMRGPSTNQPEVHAPDGPGHARQLANKLLAQLP